MFTELGRRAAGQQYLAPFETHMRLALKAQAQCRATLETLAEIKQPKQVALVRQANIAHGPQQVNNVKDVARGDFGSSTRAHGRAEESHVLQNELLERMDGERLERGTPSATGGADQDLAAVGEGDRATHGRR